MKQKLLNLKRLRGLMLLAVMCIFGAGTAWGDTKTDVIDNSVTSSTLGQTSSSSWHDVFSITGTSGAKYTIRSMGTKETTNALQWNANGYLYMTDTPSGYKLKSVKVTTTANRNIGVYAQNTAYSAAPTGTALSTLAATSSGATYTFTSDYTYLALKGTASSTSITSIEIVWEESGGNITPTYTVTYDANGGTGTMTDDNSPYEENDEVTLLANTFTAPSDMIWDSWEVKDADDNDISVTDGKFTMPASNVTVKAQWIADPYAPQYEWVETDLADLASTDIFVIVGNNYAMTNNNGASSAPATSAVTVANNKITSTVIDNIKWNVSGNATDGYTFYPNGSTTNWLYCNTTAGSSSNNNMRVGTGDRKVFELDRNNYLITKDDYAVRYLSIYSNADWRGYTSTGNGAVAIKFYKRQVVSNDPAIFADNVNIAYDATSGEISYTIDNPNGSTLSAAADAADTWITDVTVDATNSKVTFTTTANSETTPREGTITLTYGSVTKDVTVTQAAAPVIYTTIPELFAAAKSTETNVNVTFDNWVVSGVSTNGKNVFVTDNEGNGFVIYSTSDMSGTFSAGNILSGTAVACDLVLYNGFAELKNLDASELTISSGGTVATANVAMADLSGVNTGALVSYENLTCSINNNKYYLSDGTTTLQVYNALYAFDALEAGKTYSITGVYQQYNSTKEIMPRSAEDIEAVEVQHEEYTLTVSDLANVNTFVFDAADDSEMLLEGEGSIQILDGTEVLISVDVEEGYILQSLIVDGTNVTSQIESGAYTFIMPKHAVTITATAAIPTGDQYKLFSGDLVEGDYIIYYDGKAMNTTVANDRLQLAEVTPTHDVITTDNAAIVWHIAKSGEYWTIYNADANAYAASTGAKNKAQMLTDGTDDKALWTVIGEDGTYEFVNKQNTTNEVNANLRNNGEYGFACYATSTGGALSLYKKVETVPVEIGAAEYATLYYSDKAFEIPEGVTASIVTSTEGGKITFEELSGVIPAGTAVVLNGPQYIYDFKVVYVNSAAPMNNKLKGYDAPHLTEGGDKYYKLTVKDDKVGFYWGTENGEAFECGAHKAYLALYADEAKEMGYVFDGLVTEIRSIGTETVNGEIYTIGGVRVKADKLQKGIYIVNGKKMVVK